MFTQSPHVTKTLQQVLLAVLVLTAVLLLLPDRSRAATGTRCRRGGRTLAVQAHRCSLPPVLPVRQVVVRSVGRQRIVVRNDLSGPRPGVAANRCSHAGCDRVWVPGHYRLQVQRHGRPDNVWIPGHWA